MDAQSPSVRLTALLIENGRLLIVKQVLREQSFWNLPGGKLEMGETLEQGLIREMREEVGIDVEVEGLAYVTDRFKSLGRQVVDMCFTVRRVAGVPRAGVSPDGECLAQAVMVPFAELEDYGFHPKFVRLLQEGLPGRGSYQGDFHDFYGRSACALKKAC